MGKFQPHKLAQGVQNDHVSSRRHAGTVGAGIGGRSRAIHRDSEIAILATRAVMGTGNAARPMRLFVIRYSNNHSPKTVISISGSQAFLSHGA